MPFWVGFTERTSWWPSWCLYRTCLGVMILGGFVLGCSNSSFRCCHGRWLSGLLRFNLLNFGNCTSLGCRILAFRSKIWCCVSARSNCCINFEYFLILMSRYCCASKEIARGKVKSVFSISSLSVTVCPHTRSWTTIRWSPRHMWRNTGSLELKDWSSGL